FGEVVDDKVRVACREAFGVPLVDMYSSQEVGYLALQCPENEQYHLQSEHLLVEVLDDDGEPCLPGRIGRVVATTLHNFATPLLRYAVGDYAQVGEPCPCGRGLPVLTRVVGRQRNMFTLPNGDQFWPSFGDPTDFRKALSGLPRLQQFQVIQRSVDDLEVRVVTERPFRANEESAVRDYVVTSLGHPFTITFSYVGEIPRSAGGKFEDFRSEVDPVSGPPPV
ncbi:MAG: phenylacetate--CoA ligase family protein, partial [Acidimicrobiales bacterium]